MSFDVLTKWLTSIATSVDRWSAVRVLFVVASIEVIGIISLMKLTAFTASLSNDAIVYGGTNKLARRILWTMWILLIALIVYFGVCIFVALYWYATHDELRFGDALLAILTGAAFGSLTARFVWRLFGPNFRITEAIVGAGVFVLLSLAYSLPVYERQISAILHASHITSLKTPIGDVTFAERQTRHPVPGTGSQAGQNYAPSAVPHPSDPTPGIEFLDQTTSDKKFPRDTDAGFLDKDKAYIAFFSSGRDDEIQYANETIDHMANLFKPLHALAHCLRAYVNIVRDAQLLAVDLKQPVLEKLFKLQTYMAPRMQATPNQHISMWEHSWKDWQNLQVSTVNLIDKIRTDFGRTVIDENEIPGDIENECESSGELRTLRKEINDDRHPMEYVTPLQPYVPIALSSLLMAVGSTDEGVNVLAKWLDAWACARGEKAMKYCDKAGLGEIALSKQLPEWFRFRAEFQMNVLLYQLIGSDNVIYRDFIKKHSEDPEHGFMTLARSKGITLDTALDSCENHSTSVGIRDENSDALATGIRTRVLQLLVDDENSYLMAERNFVLDLDVSDLENHYRRAQRLARFTPECLEPRHGDEEADLREKTLKPLTASYKITAGLLGIKVGERMKRIADSAYDRRRADDILKESMKVLRKGRNVLKEVRGHYRDAHADELLSRSVFTTFPHEDAYSLANGAIDDLNADQP